MNSLLSKHVQSILGNIPGHIDFGLQLTRAHRPLSQWLQVAKQIADGRMVHLQAKGKQHLGLALQTVIRKPNK